MPGCSVPVGALAAPGPGGLSLSARVTSLDGRDRVSGTVGGSLTGTGPETACAALAALLREQGADAILNAFREPSAPLA